MSDTATPESARAHARAQADSEAARVAARPTLPAREFADVPAGVPREALFWAETLGPGGYASRRLPRGTRLRIDDLEGEASAGLMLYNAAETWERLNVADTVKVQWQAYLGEGSLLLSDMGRVLASLLEDDSRGHDTICGVSAGGPKGRDRFTLALAKHGLTKRDLPVNLNLFKPVRVGPEGELMLDVGEASPAHVTLRAEMDVLAVVVNVAHVLDDRVGPPLTPLRLLAWHGEVAPLEDTIRNATPERRRAFENVEAYYGEVDR